VKDGTELSMTTLLVMMCCGLIAVGCSSGRIGVVTVIVDRLDSTALLVTACSGNSQSTAIPQFTHSSIEESINVVNGDTLHIRFRNPRNSDNGIIARGSPPFAAYEEGDRCVLSRVLRDSCMTMALIDGPNSDVHFVSMRLHGVDKRIMFEVGVPQTVYPKPLPITEGFTGGLAK